MSTAIASLAPKQNPIDFKPEITSLQHQEEEEKIQTQSTLQRQSAIEGAETSQNLDTAINSAN